MLSNPLPEMALLPGLERHPRVDLGLICSNLEPLERLGAALGITLFAKRDDTQPLALGGNKIRQLEFYLGHGAQSGADTVLITGARQSNFVRSCAAAACRLGWHAVVQLEERVPRQDAFYLRSGNVLLNQMFGAEIHEFPEGENEAAADANLDQLARNCAAQGRTPYVIHLGIESPPMGGLGYAYAAAEMWQQCRDLGTMPDHVVIPSGSGLTHAGFLVGARAIGWSVPVHGICVRRDAVQQQARITKRSAEIAEMLGGAPAPGPDDILVDDATLAPGYGRINAEVSRAIEQAARTEALLLDPVYSGRTMAGLISLVERRVIAPGETVLFVHTGGLPGLFAYQLDLVPQRRDDAVSTPSPTA